MINRPIIAMGDKFLDSYNKIPESEKKKNDRIF